MSGQQRSFLPVVCLCELSSTYDGQITSIESFYSTSKTAYTDACKTHTIPVYTAVFLKMNPRVPNI